MKKGDNNLINSTNRTNVINVLWREKEITKAQIAENTDLSVPTVMKIINDLADKQLIRELGKGTSSGGKRPVILELNKDAYYIIGVDVNEYWIETVLVNLRLEIVEKRIQDIRTVDNEKTIIQRVIKEICAVLNCHVGKGEQVIGIGMGIPGLIDPKTGTVIHSTALGWDRVNVKKALREFFDGEIVVEEATRAMAAAEKRVGLAKEVNNFLYIHIGSEIGSAMIVDGRLYYGNHKSSGRLGHIPVEREGVMCECGNRGCLEQYASGNALGRIAQEKLLYGMGSQMYDLVFGDIKKVDVYTVFEAATNGDDLALKILGEAADYLGMAVTGVMNMLDPELIILDGKICRTGKIYMELFQKSLRRRNQRYTDYKVRVADFKAADNRTSVGAATFLLEDLITRGGVVEKLLRRKK